MQLFIVVYALVAAVAADVSHLPSNQYLPPTQNVALPGPSVRYSAGPVSSSYHVSASVPADQSYQVETVSAPATQSFNVESASVPGASYSASATQSYDVEGASGPAVSYSAPEASYETSSYQNVAAAPAHTFSSSEGYKYKTNRRRVYRVRRVRRDVSHISNEYLPPGGGSSPSVDYLPPIPYSQVGQYESAPVQSFSAPAVSYDSGSYDVSASLPAHSFSSTDGYRYKTARRRVIRRHRF